MTKVQKKNHHYSWDVKCKQPMLKCSCDKKKTASYFLQILKVRLLNTWLAKILSFDFYPKAAYFECKFWISWSAIIHVHNWLIGPQRVGSREKWRQWLTNLKFQQLWMQLIICVKCKFKGLKAQNSHAAK